MNPILQEKINQFEHFVDGECWYIVKQPTDFSNICYLVSFLKEYKERQQNTNLQDYLSVRIKTINDSKHLGISDNYRALRVAAFYGLITMVDTQYQNANITESFHEITQRCGGEYEQSDLYVDIIDRQLEKMYISTTTDEQYNGIRKDFKLYPVMLLYKVLVEIGKSTGRYAISLDEYRYLVATTKKHEDFLNTLLEIKLFREDSNSTNSFVRFRSKFDNRMINAIRQLSCLSSSEGEIVLNANSIDEVTKKIYKFELNPHVNSTNYLSFLGSTKTLFDDEPETPSIAVEVLNHNLFGIHMKEKNDALSERRPHVCIGWSKLGDLSAVLSKEELETKYDEAWPDAKRKSKGQNVSQIWRFVNDVQIGDYIFFADGNVCHIGRIESDYYYDATEYESQSEDYTNVRNIVWLKKNVQRSELSENLHRSLMTGMSIWTMNDYRSAVVDLLKGTYVKDDDADEKISSEPVEPQEQKEKFRAWMALQKKANGEPYSTNTIATYIGQMERGYATFDKYHDYGSVFEIQDEVSLNEYITYLFHSPGFDAFNDNAGNKACSYGMVKYGEFLSEKPDIKLELRYKTGLISSKSRNRIFFGAPGTGKSFIINTERKALLGVNNEFDYERVTFHPDYSYANFVGTYKPVPCKDEDGKDAITYEYVPGPFMRVYVNALKNGRTESVKPYLLIIEEINRANVAAVFGSIFQLLDRDEDEISEYPIQASEDIRKYLAKELGGQPEDYSKIRIPDNMFIWASMNSADQGVFPMDTAFKRRWDFTYLGIDDRDADIRGKTVVLGTTKVQKVEWNKLRKAINAFLTKLKINEDKQLGPYFISRKVIVPKHGDEIDRVQFIEVFKNKVIMYLFEDAAKQKRSSLFEGCFENSNRYSEICKEFDIKGIGIFNSEIQIAAEPMDLPNKTATEENNTEETVG